MNKASSEKDQIKYSKQQSLWTRGAIITNFPLGTTGFEPADIVTLSAAVLSPEIGTYNCETCKFPFPFVPSVLNSHLASFTFIQLFAVPQNLASNFTQTTPIVR
jgi:hypothetical protein